MDQRYRMVHERAAFEKARKRQELKYHPLPNDRDIWLTYMHLVRILRPWRPTEFVVFGMLARLITRPPDETEAFWNAIHDGKLIICNKCGEAKGRDAYYAEPLGRVGLKATCKVCLRAKARQDYQRGKAAALNRRKRKRKNIKIV